jgi:hypothetical protein
VVYEPWADGTLPGMAEKDADGPSLELPSFGLRRRRSRKDRAADEPAPPTETTAAEPEQEPKPEPEPTAVEPVPVVEAPTTPIEPVPPTAPTPEPAPEPVVEAPAAAEPARAVYVDEVEDRPVEEAPSETSPADGERTAAKQRRAPSLPSISGMTAAIVTGLLVGVLTVGLTWASLRLCEVLQGTSSCGNPGFALLFAIEVLMIVVGGMLLRVWGVPDPGSTSFLAVGLTAVIALLFVIEVIFAWSMIIVIPLISAATYALSHWVTTRYIEPAER